MKTASSLNPHGYPAFFQPTSASFRLSFCCFFASLNLHRIGESWGLALYKTLASGNVVASSILYPEHQNFLHISDRAVSFSYHLCVHWSSTLNFLQELFFCFHNLANWHRRPSSWSISAFEMSSSLSLSTSSFWFKVRDVWLFLSLESLEATVGLFTGLILILLYLRE